MQAATTSRQPAGSSWLPRGVGDICRACHTGPVGPGIRCAAVTDDEELQRNPRGELLLAAGIYQWLPLKEACLSRCRAPLLFVQQHGGFQSSFQGSLRLGFLHGMYCIGCCWALMALLFVGGVMNILWIAALMILVLLEKVLPNPVAVSRVAGLAAIAAGIACIATLDREKGPQSSRSAAVFVSDDQAAFLIRPSASMASCTFGRAATRAWNSFNAGHGAQVDGERRWSSSRRVNRYASATVKVSPVRYFLPASCVLIQSNFFLRFVSA